MVGAAATRFAQEIYVPGKSDPTKGVVAVVHVNSDIDKDYHQSSLPGKLTGLYLSL